NVVCPQLFASDCGKLTVGTEVVVCTLAISCPTAIAPKNRVLTPVTLPTAVVLVPSTANFTSVGGSMARGSGWKPIRKVRVVKGGISTGVSCSPSGLMYTKVGLPRIEVLGVMPTW